MSLFEREQTSQNLVVIGGGTGEFHTIRGLIKVNDPGKITAIPGSWDSDGSSGRLRTELGVLPPGDPRRCFFAFMEDEGQLLESLLLSDDRFDDIAGPLHGHDLINLEITRLSHIHGGFQGGIEAFRRRNRIRGHVVPSSLMSLHIITKLLSSDELFGEAALDQRGKDPNFNPKNRVVDIYLNTPASANELAVDAIRRADKIIFAPGSLWGSILPHLLIKQFRQAIIESDAPLILVGNLMTERGQTDLFPASEHLKPFLRYLKDRDRLNYMVVNSNGMPPKILEYYGSFGQEPVIIDDGACLNLAPNLKIIRAPMATYFEDEDLLRHDGDVLAPILINPEKFVVEPESALSTA